MSVARHAYLKQKGVSGITLGHRIFADYGTFDKLGSMVAPLSNWMLRRRVVRSMMERFTHIDTRAHLPFFHAESLESWFKKQPNMPRSKKIIYFMDSYANYNNPSFGKMVFALLNHLGYQVILPPQKASGMPAVEYGLLDKARSLARYNIRHLAPYAKDGTRIVCSSPASSYLLREGYGTILSDEEWPIVSRAVVDIVELLLEEYGQGNIQFRSAPLKNVKYHYCCLSKALSLGPTTSKLLRAAGIEHELIDVCCGGGGVWGTFKENYDMSSEIAGKLRNVIHPECMIITESETCRLQIEAQVTTQVHFPLELLISRIQKPGENSND